jgi:SAM-dependent methyltransferase
MRGSGGVLDQARLEAALRRHGRAGIPRAVVLRVVANTRKRLEIAAERRFDRRRRIDTAGVARLTTRGKTTRYEPVHPKAFRDFLRYLPADRSAITFLDCGSGRGRALFLAIEHGFAAAVGVEIEQAHHRVAAANRARYAGRRADIRLIHGDVRDVPIPGGPVVVFIYNPFPRAVMVDVVANIRASLRADPRPAWVIYEAPMDRDLFDSDATFVLLGERAERKSPRHPRFAIYRTAQRLPAGR